MNQAGWRCFLKLCLGTRDEHLLGELFELLLTSEEKSSLETRCLIIKALLAEQDTQRAMSSALNVSIAKITRGSNELKRISPALRAYLSDTL